MKVVNALRTQLQPALLLVLAAAYALVQADGGALGIWGKATADHLARFLPAPVPGLADRVPWDQKQKEPSLTGGCGVDDCWLFFPVHVSRAWFVEDPALVQQVTSIERQQEELIARVRRQSTPEERSKVGEELNRLPNIDDLKRRARSLGFRIEANRSPHDWHGSPTGTLRAYPLYRGYRPTPSQWGPTSVVLSVYLGPPGFTNPAGPRSKMREAVKSILVTAVIGSTPQSVKADEVLARQMLEKVDYAGLVKLLTP